MVSVPEERLRSTCALDDVSASSARGTISLFFVCTSTVRVRLPAACVADVPEEKSEAAANRQPIWNRQRPVGQRPVRTSAKVEQLLKIRSLGG